MDKSKAEVPYGTLDLLILRTLETLGPMHGFGLARRIEQISESLVHLNQGSIYPALLRLQQKGWIATKQGTSENFRSWGGQDRQMVSREIELCDQSNRSACGRRSRE